jgi:hypothetical protein
VKVTGVPEVMDWLWDGEMLTLGLAGMQPPKVICTVVLVLLTAVDVKITPGVESLKLWPTGRDISKSYVGIDGLMLSIRLLLGYPSVPRWNSTPVVVFCVEEYGQVVRKASKPIAWRDSR